MCTQSVGVGDLVDLVDLQNDKAFENLNYMHGLVTEICPNNLLKISLGDNMVIVVNRNEVQKWINTPSTATVSKISSKSKSKSKSKAEKKRPTRLPKLEGLDAECAAIVTRNSTKKVRNDSHDSGLQKVPLSLIHNSLHAPYFEQSASRLFSQVIRET